MSMQPRINPTFYQTDHLIQDKLEMILANEAVHSKHPNYRTLDILEDPIRLSADQQGNADASDQNPTEIIRILKKENSELVSIIKQLTQEKNELQNHNFELIEKLFTFENFQIEKFDHQFNQFLSRTIFLNYEISKKFLEKERENIEKMREVLLKKDEEVSSMKSKISLLEQKVLESRKLLKKTILDTPVSSTGNETTQLGSMSNLDFTKQISSQQDSMAEPRNTNDYNRRDLLNSNQLEDRLQTMNLDRFSVNLGENSFDEMNNPPERHTAKLENNRSPGLSSTQTIRKDNKNVKPSNSKNPNSTYTLPVPSFSKGGPTSQVGSPKNSAMKSGLSKSSSQKALEMHPKFKLRSGESSPRRENENLTLSFLLDQNVSVDNIQFPANVTRSAVKREPESEIKKKGNLKEASNLAQKKIISTSNVGKSASEVNKNKGKLPINTTPIVVKKKGAVPATEAK